VNLVKVPKKKWSKVKISIGTARGDVARSLLDRVLMLDGLSTKGNEIDVNEGSPYSYGPDTFNKRVRALF
jgi:hypothetical protein